MERNQGRDQQGRNKLVALVSVGTVVGMLGLSFAAVPLYRVFCQVTGYGGTTQRAEAGSVKVVERLITVRFNADVQPDLAWRFQPEQRAVTVKVGENALAFYSAENLSDAPIVGQAVYNVTPEKAGIYFNKVACFCFDQQFLSPQQRADMPVSFYVDPAFADDPDMADVKTITLSYTFFNSGEDGLKDYLENHPEALAATTIKTEMKTPEGS
ncbi:MAG: cytochrome c oxidase assembly protein [Rhodospirillaceae bacterium]|nr:cytochrome c oxidase assembly protein [Rhodospirillaceae bacterium]|tara:strand:- start:846 stop:1481 length:636 start_codon:yes stop_codon:yes gene_type:complete